MNKIANLVGVQVPRNDIHSAVEHAEVLRTWSVLRESWENEENPESAFVTVDAKKRVFLLEASSLQHVVRRVDEKVAVDRWHPRKYLHTQTRSTETYWIDANASVLCRLLSLPLSRIITF